MIKQKYVAVCNIFLQSATSVHLFIQFTPQGRSVNTQPPGSTAVAEYPAVLAVEDEKKLINEILKTNDEFKNKNIHRY